MLQNRKKFVLLLLLALLQCFAPLLHAHAHGSSLASGVHIDGVDEQVAVDSGKSVFMPERNNTPAIAMAQEYRQDGTIALTDADQPVLAAPVFSFSSISPPLPSLATAVVTAFPGGPLVYSRPFSQAPPPHLI